MKLPRLDSFLVCDGFCIDAMSGRLSVFNLLDSVFVPSMPALWYKFVAVASYELGADAVAFDDRVSLRALDGSVLNQSEQHIEAVARQPGEPVKTHHSIHMMWRNTLKDAGDLQIVLERRRDASSAWQIEHTKLLSIVVGPHPLHGPGSAAPTPSPPQG
jgi:hypothetical protein